LRKVYDVVIKLYMDKGYFERGAFPTNSYIRRVVDEVGLNSSLIDMAFKKFEKMDYDEWFARRWVELYPSDKKNYPKYFPQVKKKVKVGGRKVDYSKLSDDAREMLGYLVHDKGHVFDKKSNESVEMEEVMRVCSETYDKPLYRGVSDEEYQLIEMGKPIPYYTSYSELKEVAGRFGRVITLLPPTSAFSYWKYQKATMEEIKIEDEEEYEMVDGDYIIETALDEMEWIFDKGLTLKKTRVADVYVIG